MELKKRNLFTLSLLLILINPFIVTAQERGIAGIRESDNNGTKSEITNKIPVVLESVARIYGEPYGNLVNAFFNALKKPAQKPSQQVSNQENQDDYSKSMEEYSKRLGNPQSDYSSYNQSTETLSYYSDSIASNSQQLDVQFDLVREVNQGGNYQAQWMKDGDRLTQRDNYKVVFQSNIPCYIYIVQLDSTGKMDTIFPSRYSRGGNPVDSTANYSVPADENWFYLNENKGIETIYFIASKERRNDIEELLYNLEAKNSYLVQMQRVSMQSYAPVYRGIGGVRESCRQAVRFQNGNQGEYGSTLFSSIDADFVVTRWFYHE